MTMLRIAAAAMLFGCAPASAPDVWANGAPVPARIKRACCGPSDARHLRPDQIHRGSDEPEISVDAGVFCFFAPMNF